MSSILNVIISYILYLERLLSIILYSIFNGTLQTGGGVHHCIYLYTFFTQCLYDYFIFCIFKQKIIKIISFLLKLLNNLLLLPPLFKLFNLIVFFYIKITFCDAFMLHDNRFFNGFLIQ